MQRGALLDAARSLLSEGGTEALTFPALAERTGLARSSVYEYFRSRGAVVEELCEVDIPVWAAEVQAAIAESALSRTSLPLNVLRVLIAGLTLYWGARLVVGAAADFGAALGWTPLLVGLLPVAIGTALPEVATAVAAARRGHGDMVLGHVLGSSVVNLLLVIGAMAVLQPLALPASFVRLELPALLAFALVLYPMLRGDLKISRSEGGILLVAFAGWFVLELLLVGAPAL